MAKVLLLTAALVAVSPAVAVSAEAPAAQYQSAVNCAATPVALQQNPHPDAYGSVPDPHKLEILASHTRDAAFATGKKFGQSQADVQRDIARQVMSYTNDFHAARDAAALHDLQGRLGRTMIGCAIEGL